MSSLLPQPKSRADEEKAATATASGARTLTKVRKVALIASLASINFLNTMGSGILIAALPRISRDVGLEDGLTLWPAAVYALAAGCLLHVFGATGDIIGPKRMWICGSLLFTVFTVALGFSATGLQVILFRTCLGVAIAMCLPTTVSLVTNTFPRGPWRNTAFAMNGMAQPLGYSLGLVLGGVFTDTIGWRWSYYIMAMLSFLLSAGSLWSLPPTAHDRHQGLGRLRTDVDWIGAVVLSASLGLLMYVLSTITSDYHAMSEPANICLLVASTVLLVLFPLWMRYQVSRQRPALIPNRLWRTAEFTSACLCVFFCWASLNSIEYFTTLYFQEVQGLSALQSSIRFFSQIIMGTAVNVVLVYLVSRIPAWMLAVGSGLVTLVSPAIMATVDLQSGYWAGPCWALFLCPVNPWVLFTISSLVITEAFPVADQSLAGGVFNQVAQFGNSVGLAIAAVAAASVTEQSAGSSERIKLMDGYRAAFWTIFASTLIVCFVSLIGYRGAGIVGRRHEDPGEA